MSLLIGSILVMALHALVVSSARMMRRAEAVQQVARSDMAIQRTLRRQTCTSSPTLPGGADVRARRVAVGEDGRALTVVERRDGDGDGDGWRQVAAAADRCDLPERCEWDIVARACRETAVAP